jgi:hypothetical protein
MSPPRERDAQVGARPDGARAALDAEMSNGRTSSGETPTESVSPPLSFAPRRPAQQDEGAQQQ